MGGLRSGSSLGATNHRNTIPKLPTMTAGSAKSNMLKRSRPWSWAIATTSRLVDVPMVVAIPPTRVASPMGIRMADGANLLRTATPTSMGRSMTTMGVLLRNALSTPLATSVTRLARQGPRHPGLGQKSRHGLQRAGNLKALAHDHEGTDGDKGLVAESKKEVLGPDHLAVRLVREELEAEDQDDQDRQAGGFQRQAVAGEQEQRQRCYRQHENGVAVG